MSDNDDEICCFSNLVLDHSSILRGIEFGSLPRIVEDEGTLAET